MDGGKYSSVTGKGGGVVGMGVEGDRGGGVYYLLEVPEVVMLMSCNAPLKASRLSWVNTLDGSLFHWPGYCSGK